MSRILESLAQHFLLLDGRREGRTEGRTDGQTDRQIDNLQIDVMFHEPHPGIPRPTFLIVVTHNIFIIWIGMLGQITLYQIPGFISGKSTIIHG